MKLSSHFGRFVILLAAVLVGFTGAHAQANPVDDLRTCLLQMKTAQSWQQREELKKKCIALAEPLAEDPSVSGRALYIQTLQLSQTSDSLTSYLDLFNQIDSYFVGHLRAYVSADKLAALSPTELEDAFNASGQEVFYSALTQLAPLGVNEVRSLFGELERRGVATSDDAVNLYQMYSAISDYSSADQLATSWSNLPHPPQIIGSDQIKIGELNYLTLSRDKATLAPSIFRKEGAQILVFGDCHFAYDAFEQLSVVDGLQDVMKAHGLVISGAGDIDADLIDSLRKKYPAFEMHPIYQTGQWFQKNVNVVASPNFAFMVDGVTKFTIPGDAANIADLFCQGLSQIGLARPTGCPASH